MKRELGGTNAAGLLSRRWLVTVWYALLNERRWARRALRELQRDYFQSSER